jgi:hypothetical protein
MKRSLLTATITRKPRGLVGRTFEQKRNEITTRGKVLDVVGGHLLIEWIRNDGSKDCTLCPVADLVSGVSFGEVGS